MRISRKPALVSGGLFLSRQSVQFTTRKVTVIRGLVTNDFATIDIKASGGSIGLPSGHFAPCRRRRNAGMVKFVAFRRNSGHFCGGIFIRRGLQPRVRGLTRLVRSGPSL